MAQGPVWGGGCRCQWKGARGEGADQTGPGRSLDFSLWMTGSLGDFSCPMTWADLGLGKLAPGIQQVLLVREPVQPSQEGQTEGRCEGRHRASGKGRQARVLPYRRRRLPGEGAR